MIHLLLAMLHNMLPAKVGLGAGKFLAAGIPAKAGAFGHNMVLAQAAAPIKGTASLVQQTAHSTGHFGGKMFHTAKGIGLFAQKGANPIFNFFQHKGFTPVWNTFEAGTLIMASHNLGRGSGK